MSVINRMLEDLERRSGEGHQGRLPGQVKAVPARRRVPLTFGLALVALGAAAAVGWQAWRTGPAAPAARVAANAEPRRDEPRVRTAPTPSPFPPGGAERGEGTIQDQRPGSNPSDAPATPQAGGSAAQVPTSVLPPPAAPTIRFDTELNSLRPEGSTLGVRPEGEVTRRGESAPPGTKSPGGIGVRPALPAEPAPAKAVAARPETAPPSISVPPRPTPVQAKEPAPSAATKGEVTRSGESPRGTIDKRVRPMTAEQRAVNEYRNAVALLQQGRNREAAGALEAALRMDPAHEAARQTLVGILLHENRVAEAEKTLQAGLDYNPRQVGFAMMLARVQADRGDSRGALATLAQVEAYASTSAQLHGFMAALLQREGRHPDAVVRYQEALRLAPGAGVWLMGLGISLQAEHRLPEAREAFSQARASGQLSADLTSFVDQRLAELKARPGK